jgi:subtilisin family serine protease
MAPDAQIMTCKFWNSFSGEQTVWDGMQYGVDNGADLLTASLGWPHSVNPDRVTWRNVCENSIAAGVVVIYAAGNEGCFSPPDNVRTPGDVPDVLTIGATDCNDNIASFSSCGPITWEGINPFDDCPYPPGCIKPDVSAPGVNTTSHSFCNGYSQLSGTSMATPHVAGAVALMLQANPNLDHFDVKNILESTAIDLGQSGKDNTYGSGRVDAYQAVLAAGGNPPACMKLEVDQLVAGQTSNFKVTKNIVRGDTVAIVWGTGGNPETVNAYGYCATFEFDLPGNPQSRVIAQGFVDQNEEFNASKLVPGGVSGMHVLIQAAKRGTCPDECMSNVLDETVQ